NEVNSKPPSGPAQNASQVANAAVGHVSIGFGLCNPQNAAANPITLSGMLNPYANSQGNSNTAMSNNDYAAALTEIAQSDGGVLARAFRQAGFAALLNEMCGLPAQLASGKAGKAAIACAQQIQNHDEADVTQDSTSLLLSIAKSAGAASASGTLSEVPLDRCTLNQVLWLHIVTSVAKGGGFRGNIWGGTRILDDPVLGLVRTRPLLVQKLLTRVICRGYSQSIRVSVAPPKASRSCSLNPYALTVASDLVGSEKERTSIEARIDRLNRKLQLPSSTLAPLACIIAQLDRI
ncbi:hypothetical protein Ciccas_009608, partial [Cichlidogyrus casuarinus]